MQTLTRLGIQENGVEILDPYLAARMQLWANPGSVEDYDDS
jgi:hypothetical protein